jgi:hypothetical protein
MRASRVSARLTEWHAQQEARAAFAAAGDGDLNKVSAAWAGKIRDHFLELFQLDPSLVREMDRAFGFLLAIPLIVQRG